MVKRSIQADQADIESLRQENARLKESMRQAKRMRALYEGSLDKIKGIEASLFDANTILQMLHRCEQALLTTESESAWLHEICNIIVKKGHYHLAWMGFFDKEEEGVRLVAHSGIEVCSAESGIVCSLDDAGPCPAVHALQDEQPKIIEDIRAEPACTPWYREAIDQGLLSSVFLPLRFGESDSGVLSLYAKSASAFAEERLDLLSQLAGEISFGITFLREKAKHRKARDKLEATRKELLSITNSVPVIVYRYRRDEDGTPHIIYISERIESLWGTSVSEAVENSQSMFQYIHPEDLADFMEADRLAWESRAPFSHMMRVLTPKQELRWLHLQSSPSMTEDGTLVYSGVVEDVTERKQAEDELQQSEVRFRTLLDTLKQGIFLKSVDSTYLSCNEAHAHLAGLSSPKDIIGKKDDELFPPEMARKYQADDRKVIKTGETLEIEESMLVDGKTIPVQTVKTPMRDEADNITGILGIYWDITEQRRAALALKESEKKYRQLFENMTAAFALHEIICDEKGKPVDYRFIEANPAFEEFTGIPLKGLAGKTVLEVLPDTEDYWIDTYGKVALTGKPVAIEHFARELSRYYDVWAFSPRKDQFATIFNDITDRKELEESLLKSKADLLFAAKVANLVYWEFDLASNEFIFNDPFYALLKTTAEKEGGYRMALADYANRFVHPDDADEVGRNTEKLIRSNDPDATSELESRIVCADGEVRWQHIRLMANRSGSGKAIGLRGVNLDITDRKKQETLLQARIRLTEISGKADHQNLMQATLDVAEEMTGSNIGFFHFVDEDQESIALQAWSTNTIEHMCTAEEAGKHYPVSKAGVWADAIRHKKTVVHNDYPHLEGRQGIPEGHAAVQREACIPVVRKGKVVAVIGVGNKQTDYSEADCDMVGILADLTWDLIEITRAEKQLQEHQQRYSTLFEAITDAAFVHPIHSDGKPGPFLEVNEEACRLTGYSRDELLAMAPGQLDAVDSGVHMGEVVSRTISEKSITFEQVYLSRDERRIPVEVHAQLFDLDSQTAVFSLVRDITERKQAEASLRKRLDELERFSKASVRREFRIKELKNQLEMLKNQQGEDQP